MYPVAKIPGMKRWRPWIIGLLLVTVPLSLWASVAAPADCASAMTPPASPAPSQIQDDVHAHHGMDKGADATTDPETADSNHHDSRPGANEPCCDTCLSACLGSGHSLLPIPLTTVAPSTPDGHFSKTHASQVFPGPDYPSLYRPPISQI